MRAHSASALTLLHQPTEGKHGREGERKTLPYFPAPEWHEVSKWSERERRERLKVGGEVEGSIQAGVITYIDSGAV